MKTNLITFVIVIMIFINQNIGITQHQYYYAFDKKIELIPSKEKSIIKFVIPVTQTLLTQLTYQNRSLNVKIIDSVTCIIEGDRVSLSSFIHQNNLEEKIYTQNTMYLTKDGIELGVTDEICIEYKDNISKRERDELIEEYKLILKRANKFYDLVGVRKKQNALTLSTKIQESGLVKYSHPNFFISLDLLEKIPNDEYFNQQFAFHNVQQLLPDVHKGALDADIDAPAAWELTQGSRDIVIAVVDQGICLSHPDLKNNIWINTNEIPNNRIDDDGNGYIDDLFGWNFRENNNNPEPKFNDAHGIACAGIISAEQNNGEGITGIAPNCKIMGLKLGFGIASSASSDFADAIDYAWMNGADIISNSWGRNSSNSYLLPVIVSAIERATEMGRQGKGCSVLFAAGNTANHENGDEGYVCFPANVEIPGVLTVGASNRNDFQANYTPSSYQIDIAAPSHHAYPNQIAGENFEIWTLDIPDTLGYNPDRYETLPDFGTNYLSYTGRFGGTSAACPLVAGVAALVLSVNPDLTQLEVFDILTSTADKVGRYNYYSDYRFPGHSTELGYGRLNAYMAVLKAKDPEFNNFYEIPGVGDAGNGAGVAFTNLDDDLRPEMFLMAYDNPYGQNKFRLVSLWNVDSKGKGTWTKEYVEIDGVGSVGDGADLVFTNLDQNPRPELVLVAYDNPVGANEFRYIIGWNFNKLGEPVSWTGEYISAYGVGHMGDGAGIAITNLDDNPRPDMLLMAYDDPPGANSFRYRVCYNLSETGIAESIGEIIEIPGLGYLGEGAGIDLVNLDENPRPEIVLMVYDAPDGPNNFRLKIGMNIDSEGKATWLNENVYFPMEISGVGDFADGAGLRFLNLDNDSHPEMILMAYNRINGTNNFRYKINWNLGTTSFNLSQNKELSSSPNFDDNRYFQSLPEYYDLCQNHPNPFNPETTISFALPQNENVQLKIFNLQGQLISTLINQEFKAGKHTIRWNGTDDLGQHVCSGIYFYQMISGDFSLTRKMLLTR